jgi:S-adenosylmethionine hydrolase
MNAPLITLLTDFGVEDAYVAQMKGQILAICPTARVIDITHAIPPQDIAYAGLVLAQAVPHFPSETVHVAVIDPGVGTQRRIIAVELATRTEAAAEVRRQRLVLPDNGLIGRLASQAEVVAVCEVSESGYWRSRVSSTFHGRDIMGPVAAHWASGTPLDAFGPRIDDMLRGAWPQPSIRGATIAGEIIAIDHFGNAITNIPGSYLTAAHAHNLEVIVGGRRVQFHPVRTYGQQPPGASVILTGSHELVELAIVGGSAAGHLGLKRGESVCIAGG